MNEDRRKAEELREALYATARTRAAFTDVIAEALRQARLEEAFRIEEKHGGDGRVWYSLQKRDWVAHSIWGTRQEAEEAADAIAKRRGVE